MSLDYPLVGVDIPAPFGDTEDPDGVLCSRGYVARDYDAVPLGQMEFASPFPIAPIPRDEWRERIEEMDARQAWPSNHWERIGKPCLHQNGTNYCWFNAFISAAYLMRAANGLPHVDLSPGWGAAQIKGYRNRGGNTPEAIRWMATKGTCEQKFCPPNAIDRKYETAEAAENAKLYRIPEWWELPGNSYEHMVTCLLHGFPVVIGVLWWGHMICAMRVKHENGQFPTLILNSHGKNYGKDGAAYLSEKKATAFDQLCPRTVTPSGFV